MSDKTPAGKHDDIALREIKEMEKDLSDGINTVGKKMAVCQMVKNGLSECQTTVMPINYKQL